MTLRARDRMRIEPLEVPRNSESEPVVRHLTSFYKVSVRPSNVKQDLTSKT
jgi:hypothetical protein